MAAADPGDADHHGCPRRRELTTGEGREWLAAQPLPAAARAQVAVAMIDALEMQIAPLDKELRAYARRRAGCQALMVHYGIGPLVAVTILAELATAPGSPHRGTRSATRAWTSPCTSPISAARRGISRAKGRRR